MAKKKVLIFSLAYHPFIGGAEIALKEITDRLGRDFEFDMVTLKNHTPSHERVGNVGVYRVGLPRFGRKNDFSRLAKYTFPLFAFLKSVSLHRKNHYNLIWSMMANYAGFGALFFNLVHPKVPFLLSLQEGDPISYIKKRVGITYPLFKKIFTRATIIQTISHYLADFAVSMGFRGRVVVVPNGVDISCFTQEYSDEVLEKTKVELKKKEHDIFLVTTSRLVVKNGISDVIRSLTLLPDNVKFLIIGKGPEEEELKKLVLDLKLDTRVTFYGFVDYAYLPKYLKISDIFIRPSLSEGFGNSFVEAMATGIPVIATPVGGIVDFLFDPERNSDIPPTGLFCEVSNSQSIARQVKRYLENPALREQIIGNAKKMVFEKYDWNVVAQDMKEKVLDLLFKGSK